MKYIEDELRHKHEYVSYIAGVEGSQVVILAVLVLSRVGDHPSGGRFQAVINCNNSV